MTKKKLFLVTGGAGFIGSNVVEKLVSIGHRVRVIDNFATGRRENIEPLMSSITFLEDDINNRNAVKDIMDGVDVVIHTAAIPSVQRSVEDPTLSNHANVSGTLNLLNIARELKVKRFVYSASSSAYGDTPVLPKVETMQPNPKSPYATSKYVGELYCRNFYDLFGLETISLRYFNVFGPRQDPASHYAAVIPKFIMELLRGDEPIIYGDGEQTRDFTYIENVIRANILASESPVVRGESINIACGENCSLNKLLDILQKIIGTNIKPRFKDMRLGDVRDSLADITLARKLIGYEPVVYLKEGLEHAVEWYRQ
ncbi:MAG: SDR family oxidoreductase [Spirochaetes bacterium]|nr:SDR family oxidoreductase [Spirochaetota bacterium]